MRNKHDDMRLKKKVSEEENEGLLIDEEKWNQARTHK